MKMRAISRAIDKKLSVNNNLGRALKFYSSIRLDVRRIETVKEGGESVSNKVKIKVVKNKVAPPFKETIVTIKFGKGLDKDSEIFDISVANGERIGQGAENAKKYINDHPEIKERLTKIATEGYNSEEFTPSEEEKKDSLLDGLSDKDIIIDE